MLSRLDWSEDGQPAGGKSGRTELVLIAVTVVAGMTLLWSGLFAWVLL